MNATDHPYRHQPQKAFWRQAVQERHFLEIRDWYARKWPITELSVATAGSCFAQHIGRRLRSRGFRYLDVEPPPSVLPSERHLEFGYGMYSARYGNVYTTRQLLQLLQRALGEFSPVEQVWSSGAGWVDAFRPTIEPEPAGSIDEVDTLRSAHLDAVGRLFEKTDLFVFTLGLTEVWLSRRDGAAYPLCPGTQAGRFDPAEHVFANLGHAEVVADLEAFIARARSIRPDLKLLLTVSPVPLAATASAQHVVSATSYSKAVLRSAAGYLAEKYAFVDYFPSFEIVSSTPMRGAFFNPDLRTVVEDGVEHVMRQFFAQHPPPGPSPDGGSSAAVVPDDVACDEEILAAFGDAR